MRPWRNDATSRARPIGARLSEQDASGKGVTVYFKQFLDERCGCASYVIASRETHEAAIVDPSIEIAQYDELLRERDFRLRFVIDTHIHADHVSGAGKLAAKHGAERCLHESAQVRFPFRPLHDGEEVPLGQLRLRVLHTPGHRPELISLLIVNPPRSPEPSMLLTGDSLLVGDVGRPDFGGGDAAHQYASVQRLLQSPDWVAVFPGHFEGPCGKGMCGRPSTTIGFERRFNPLLQLDQPAFIASLVTEVPARPLNMTAIEATNRGITDQGWAMLTSSPAVPEVTVDEFAAFSTHPFRLDVREPDEFAHGHIPGAINVPQAELASRLAELPRDRPILTICKGGSRSLRTAQFLKQVHFADVQSLRGGTDGWRSAGQPLAFGDTADVPQPRVVESAWTHAGVVGPAGA